MARKQNQEIIQLVKSLQTLAKKAVIEYKQEMDEIIDSGCRDKRRIERILDGMLGFVSMTICLFCIKNFAGIIMPLTAMPR